MNPDEWHTHRWTIRSLLHTANARGSMATTNRPNSLDARICAEIAVRCVHCGLRPEDHVDGKCLFDATTYQPRGAT